MTASKPPEPRGGKGSSCSNEEVSFVRLRSGVPAADEGEAPPERDEGRATVPPPVPESEYVARMMRRAVPTPFPSGIDDDAVAVESVDDMVLGPDDLVDTEPIEIDPVRALRPSPAPGLGSFDLADEPTPTGSELEERASSSLGGAVVPPPLPGGGRARPPSSGAGLEPPLADIATPLVPPPLADVATPLIPPPLADSRRAAVQDGSEAPSGFDALDRQGAPETAPWGAFEMPQTRRGLGDSEPVRGPDESAAGYGGQGSLGSSWDADLSMDLSIGEPALAAISDIPVSADPAEIRLGSTPQVADEWTPQAPGGLDFDGDTVLPPFARASATPAQNAPLDPIARIRERYDLGDFTGALVVAEGVLEDDPHNAVARRYVDDCRDMLLRMYLSRIGDTSQVPRVVMEPEQLRWLTLDHRAGFLLSCIDGASSIEELLDVCSMSPLEALRILYDLLQQGAISVDPPPRRGRR